MLRSGRRRGPLTHPPPPVQAWVTMDGWVWNPPLRTRSPPSGGASRWGCPCAVERYVIIIKPDGWHGLLRCYPGDTLSLEELQGLVEGYIETVNTVLADNWSRETDVGIIMLVNEEGKLLGLPVNQMATDMIQHPFDTIVGTAVLMGRRGAELVGLTRPAAEHIADAWLKGEENGHGPA